MTAGFCLKGKGDGKSQWTRIPIAGAKVEGSPSEVTLTRSFLSKALRFGLNQIDLADSLSAVRFCGQGKQLVVMSLRLESAATPVPEPQPTQVKLLSRLRPR